MISLRGPLGMIISAVGGSMGRGSRYMPVSGKRSASQRVAPHAQCGCPGQSDGADDAPWRRAGIRRRKKNTGRKRHVVVDTVGLLWAVLVSAAKVQDRDGAKQVLECLVGRMPRLRLV
jgi:hypothetical protein